MSTNYDVYADGRIRNVKDSFYFFVVVVWGFLCLKYGLKITKQLKRAGSERDSGRSKEEKRILRFCYMAFFILILCFFWKFIPLLSFAGRNKNFYGIPPCKLSSFNIISAFFLLIQFSVIYILQPGEKKATTRAVMKIRSTLMGTKSATSKQTGNSSNTGNSSGASSTKGSSASSSTGMSSSSSRSSKVKSSSVVPSGVSELSEMESGASEMESGASGFESGASEYDELQLQSGVESRVEEEKV